MLLWVLLSYPVLQSADILLVRANLVPVGKDQESHIELTREIPNKFIKMYPSTALRDGGGEVFPEPEALIGNEAVTAVERWQCQNV